VKADPLLLERAISNVLRNSIRYAGHAGPIDATAHAEGPWVSLTIKDCGPGVKEDMLKNLAEPFFRPEPSRNRDSGGVGLGLAIVKSCIEACQGSFTVRNGQERGLEVVLKLKGSPQQANDSKPST
jgi:two-component system sensor histidine kinase CpxA